MDILFEAVRAVGLLVAAAALIFVAPLLFMLVFSLVSGFSEARPGARAEDDPVEGWDERPVEAPADER